MPRTFFSFLVTLANSNAVSGSDEVLNCELAESGLQMALPAPGNGVSSTNPVAAKG